MPVTLTQRDFIEPDNEDLSPGIRLTRADFADDLGGEGVSHGFRLTQADFIEKPDTEYHVVGAVKRIPYEIGGALGGSILSGLADVGTKARQESDAMDQAVEEKASFQPEGFPASGPPPRLSGTPSPAIPIDRLKDPERAMKLWGAFKKVGEENKKFYRDRMMSDPDVKAHMESISRGTESFWTEALGSLGPTVSGVFTSTIPVVGPVLTNAMFLDLNKGEIYDQTKPRLLKQGMNEEEAEKRAQSVAWTGGIINSLLDTFGADFIAESATKPVRRRFLQFLIGMGASSAVEGGTEGTQGVIGKISEEWASRPEGEDVDRFASRMMEKAPELMEIWGHDAAIGAVTGGGTHAVLTGPGMLFEKDDGQGLGTAVGEADKVGGKGSEIRKGEGLTPPVQAPMADAGAEIKDIGKQGAAKGDTEAEVEGPPPAGPQGLTPSGPGAGPGDAEAEALAVLDEILAGQGEAVGGQPPIVEGPAGIPPSPAAVVPPVAPAQDATPAPGALPPEVGGRMPEARLDLTGEPLVSLQAKIEAGDESALAELKRRMDRDWDVARKTDAGREAFRNKYGLWGEEIWRSGNGPDGSDSGGMPGGTPPEAPGVGAGETQAVGPVAPSSEAAPVEAGTGAGAGDQEQRAGGAEQGVKQEVQVHDYSSTQVNLPEKEAKAFRDFGAKIPDSEIYEDPKDPSYGRENEPHITVKYGLDTVNPKEVEPLLADHGPITAKLGKVSIFESDDYDVVKVDIESPELHALNKKIADNLKVTDTHSTYKPHATIAYVKKGEGKKYVGDTSFEGKEITFDSLVFSGKDGKETVIPLKGKLKRTGTHAVETLNKVLGEGFVPESLRTPELVELAGELGVEKLSSRPDRFELIEGIKKKVDTLKKETPPKTAKPKTEKQGQPPAVGRIDRSVESLIGVKRRLKPGEPRSGAVYLESSGPPLPRKVIKTPSGKPFKNREAALNALKKQKLSDLDFDMIQKDGGFVPTEKADKDKLPDAAKQVIYDQREKARIRKLAESATSLRQWVKLAGGIRRTDPSFKGELRDASRGKGSLPPYIFNKVGKGIDEMTAQAIEAGWLPPGSTEEHFIDGLINDKRDKFSLIGDENYFLDKHADEYQDHIERLKNEGYDEADIEGSLRSGETDGLQQADKRAADRKGQRTPSSDERGRNLSADEGGVERGRSSPVDEDGFDWSSGEFVENPDEVREQRSLFGAPEQEPFSLTPEELTAKEKLARAQDEARRKGLQKKGPRPVFQHDKGIPVGTGGAQKKMFGPGAAQQDLFDRGIDTPNQEQPVYDVETTEEDIQLKPAETPRGLRVEGAPRVQYRTSGRIKAQGRFVSGPSDVASLLARLRTEPDEYFYSVAVDKNGAILEIHEHTKGGRDRSNVVSDTVIGRAIQHPGVDKVYFAHAHPAGDPTPSNPDMNTSRVLDRMARIAGIKSESIIIGGNKFVTYDENGKTRTSQTIKPVLRKVSIDKMRRRAGRATQVNAPTMSDPNQANKFIKDTFNNEDGVLFLSGQHKPIAFLPFVKGRSMQQMTRDILSLAESVNSGAIVVKNDDVTDDARHRYIQALMLESLGDLRFLDLIENGKSLALNQIPSGRLQAVTPEKRDEILGSRDLFSRNRTSDKTPRGMKAVEVRTLAENVAGAFKGLLAHEIVVLKSEKGLPTDVARRAAEGREEPGNFLVRGLYDVAPDTGKRTIYLFSDAMDSRRDVIDVLIHEAFHDGVSSGLGDKARAVFLSIYKEHEEAIRKVAENRGLDLETDAGKAEATEEWIVDGMVKDTLPKSVWDRIIRAVKEMLRKAGVNLGYKLPELGLKEMYPAGDVRQIIRDAVVAGSMEQGAGSREQGDKKKDTRKDVVSKKIVPFKDRPRYEQKIIEEYNQPMTTESWKTSYDEEAHWTEEAEHSPLADELVRDLKRDGVKKGTILEIGIGNGRDSIFLAKKGYRVTGIDVADKAVQIAKENASKNNVEVDFEKGDAENLFQVESDSLDAVYSVAALHSTPIKFTFAELFRVLKPGGQAKVFLYTRTKTGNKWISYWAPGEIKQYAKEAGFRVEKFREGHDANPIEIPGVEGKVEQETYLVVTTFRKPINTARSDNAKQDLSKRIQGLLDERSPGDVGSDRGGRPSQGDTERGDTGDGRLPERVPTGRTRRDAIRKVVPDTLTLSKDIIYQGLPDEVRQRLEKSGEGLGAETLLQRIKRGASDLWNMRRHFEKLGPKFGHISDPLRVLEGSLERSRQKASAKLVGILEGLGTPENKRTFELFIAMDDMLKDLDSGLLEEPESRGSEAALTGVEGEERTLPFGFKSGDEARAFHAHLQDLISNTPAIQKALDERQAYMKDLRQQLVDADLLKPETLNDDRYFHHQVLLYRALENLGQEFHWKEQQGDKDVRLRRQGWQRARKGSMLDYSTEYVGSEFEIISQSLHQLDIKAAMDTIQERADVFDACKAKAKAWNEAEVYRRNQNSLEDPFKPFRQRIAMNTGQLIKLAADESAALYDAAGPGFRDVVDEMVEGYNQYLEDLQNWKDAGGKESGEPRPTPTVDHPRWFPFLAHLLANPGTGTRQAAGIFKAIMDRNNFIKATLGKDFKTWRDMVPEGYVEWDPKPDGNWFRVNAITDQMLEQMRAGTRPIPERVAQVFARVPSKKWVIPAEVAHTMDHFQKPMSDFVLSKGLRWMQNRWKQWTLLNPLRVIKYNTNNTSGDLDIALAYSPKIAGPYAAKAAVDLARKTPAEDLKAELAEARERDVIGSGWALQEVEGIQQYLTAKGIMDLMANKGGIVQKWIASPAKRYWRTATDFTVWRENVLRLAAYRYFKDQIAAGKKPGKDMLGASSRAELKALADGGATANELAAKMARELVGDYGNISKGGQWLRSYVMPFWSWMEINAPRYVRLMINASHEDRSRLRSAVAMGAQIGWKMSMLAAKASMLYGAILLWNAMMFPDEDDDMKELQRKDLHLILGRREDGSILSLRFEGALSDALDWFDLTNIAHDVGEVADGNKNVKDLLFEHGVKAPVTRLGLATRPDVKGLAELIMGRSLYPDPYFPKPIRDRWEHVAGIFSLQKPYQWIAGKPKRGADTGQRILDDVLSMGFYMADPGEMAYWNTRKVLIDWQKKQQKEPTAVIPTDKANALYYYKQALRYGDLGAAQKYLRKYVELGGTLQGMDLSVKAANPLNGVSRGDKEAFLNSLTPDQQRTLNRAEAWYTEVYEKDQGKMQRLGDVLAGQPSEVRNEFLKPPIVSMSDADQPVMEEIYRLQMSGALAMGPPSRTLAINGIPRPMNDEQYGAYMERSSAAAMSKLRSIIGSSRWERSTDEHKAQMARDIISAARKRARSRIKGSVARSLSPEEKHQARQRALSAR